MITLATEDDLQVVVELCEEFYSKTPYSKVAPFDWNSSFSFAQKAVQAGKDEAVILLSRNKLNFCTGLLGAVKSKLVFSGEDMALEVVWYAENNRDLLKLFDAFLYWSKNVAKCSRIQTGTVVGLKPEILGKFYKKHGFIKIEESWLR